MNENKVMLTVQLFSFFVFIVLFVLGMNISNDLLSSNHLKQSTMTSTIGSLIDNLNSINGDLITGYVPYESEINRITPGFSEEEISLGSSIQIDSAILEMCSLAHRNSADCFNLLKSIISVTSKGNSDHSSDLGHGLVPLRSSQVDFSEFDESNIHENLREASNYIMRLYDTYSGDLAFTTLAYLASRAVSNNIMLNIHSKGITPVNLGVILDELNDVYDDYHEMNLLPKDDIAQYYVDILFAYNYWSGRPMADSSIERMMFDHGTISINPSFSTNIKYNIRDFLNLRDLIISYAENSDIIRTPEGSWIEREFSYLGLRDYLIENVETHEIIGTDDNAPIKINEFKVSEGFCNPILDDFNKIVNRLMQCINRNVNCVCDLSDLTFSHPGYKLHISIKLDSSNAYKEYISFEIKNERDEVVKERKYVTHTRGSIDTKLDINSAARGSPMGILFDKSSEPWILDGFELAIFTIIDDDLIRMVKAVIDTVNLPEKSCDLKNEYQYICIKSNTAYAYNEFTRSYAPIEHQLAFALNPTEFEDYSYKVDLDDLEPKEVDISYVPTTPGGPPSSSEEILRTISPGLSCADNHLCRNNILLGKPASYTNSREKLIIYNLSFSNYQNAIDYFKQKSFSEINHQDWIPERHNTVHYLIDLDRNQVYKLAREDAIVHFSRFYDSNSIHVGVISSSSDSYQGSSLELLKIFLSEIMLRNDISIMNFLPNNRLTVPNDLEDYNYEYPQERNIENDIFINLQGAIHNIITQYKSDD